MIVIEQIAKGMCLANDRIWHDLNVTTQNKYIKLAKTAIIAALPHIKEAMEFHGVQGAMNKQIIKRIEDQLK